MIRIKKEHIKDKAVIARCCELADLSRKMFNSANYILRQAYTNHPDKIPEYQDLIVNNFIHWQALIKRMVALDNKDYRALNSYTSGMIVKGLAQAWKSRFALMKKYKNDGKKVGLIKYAKDNECYIIWNCPQDLKITEDGYYKFPKMVNIPPVKNIVDGNLVEIRLIYRNGEYYFYHVYEAEFDIVDVDKNKTLAIDIGIDNIMTAVDNDGEAFIVNGKTIKSINQFFNKQMAKAHSFVGDKGTSNRIKALCHKRANRFDNILHEMSNQIVNYCIEKKIGNIIIGKNIGWKQRCKLGKKTKQHFIQIPHARLIDLVAYKADQFGISIKCDDEAHTSKTDALAKEEIKHHEKYLGRRVKRGLFKSSTGIDINADVNAALNIMRKQIGDDFIDDLNMDKLIAPYKI